MNIVSKSNKEITAAMATLPTEGNKNSLSTKHVVQEGAIDEMGVLCRTRIPPNELSIEMYSHQAHVGQYVGRQFYSARQDILWLGYNLCKDALKHRRIGGIPLTRRQ